jgi:hypothetical protein
MLHPRYRDQLVNALYGSNYYLFRELNVTYKYIMYTVQSFFNVKAGGTCNDHWVLKGLTICTDFHYNVF